MVVFEVLINVVCVVVILFFSFSSLEKIDEHDLGDKMYSDELDSQFEEGENTLLEYRREDYASTLGTCVIFIIRNFRRQLWQCLMKFMNANKT